MVQNKQWGYSDFEVTTVGKNVKCENKTLVPEMNDYKGWLYMVLHVYVLQPEKRWQQEQQQQIKH